ncbi:hypothetical protein ACP70R_043911 [Stipagrostis hirtigluma subsp. patula]
MGSTSVKLPVDILMEIFAGLEVPDLARAGSVCSSWRRACTSILDLGCWKQRQTPCLLYTAKSRGASTAGLYSLAEKKPYTLAVPDPPIRSRMFIGSAHGWLITADEHSELHLVNPVTGDQIALPSVTTIEGVSPIYGEDGAVQAYQRSWSWRGWFNEWKTQSDVFALHKLRYYFFEKAFLSCDPSTGSYIVALIHNTDHRLSFVRGGDDRWTWLSQHDSFEDCVFQDELLYASTTKGAIHVFDLSGPVLKQKVVLEDVRDNCVEGYRIFIVQAPCGDLLQIWHQVEDDLSQPELDQQEKDGDFSEPELDLGPYPHWYPTFKVYRVDLVEKKLVEISNFNDNVLFLGFNQSLCLRADEYPQLKANHVYFTDVDVYMAICGKNERRSIGVLNLSDNSIEKIVSPKIWSNWPSPVWITPNPRKMVLRIYD